MDFTWGNNIQSPMVGFLSKIAETLPNILSALLILFIGYLISRFLMKMSEKILKKLTFDSMSDRVGIHEILGKFGIKKTSSEIISILVFWLFMLNFVISAAETIKLENVTKTVDSFVLYLPNVIGAAFVFVLGLMASNFIYNFIQRASDTVNSKYFKIFGTFVRSLLIVVVIVLAVGQLKIETKLLDNILQIILVAGGAVLAFSLGLGTRDIAKAIVSGFYARDLYKEGVSIKVKDYKGKVLQVGAVTTLIETNDGKKIHFPNEQLITSIIEETQ